jgi:UDP-glucose 4-epimerase
MPETGAIAAMTSVLVTGAAGFVGTHLMKELRLRGIPTIGVSRTQSEDLTLIPSYNSEVNWGAHLQGVDAVIHLAARVHVMKEIHNNPLREFQKANVDATIHLARAAARSGVRRFVFVSTIKVNGENTELGRPFTADAQPNPQGPYALSKADAESALRRIGLETGMEVAIIRPPLVYGPGVRGNFLSLMKWASSGAPSVFSAVQNRRSLVHVENLCDLIISAAMHPKAANHVFLVSDGRDLSTDELLTRLTAAAGRRQIHMAVPPAILRSVGRLMGRSETISRLLENLQVDITKTCTTLNWTPRISIEDGLELQMQSPVW